MCLARLLHILGMAYDVPSLEQDVTAFQLRGVGLLLRTSLLQSPISLSPQELLFCFLVGLCYSGDFLKWMTPGLVNSCKYLGFSETPFSAGAAGALWSGASTLFCGSLRLSSVSRSWLDVFSCLL